MHTSARFTLGVSAVLAAVSLAACSSSGGSGDKVGSSTANTTSSSAAPPSSSSSSAAATDYTSLLIAPSDIPVPGVTEGTPSAPPQGTGVTVAFTADGGRSVGDTIVILPDAATAQSAVQTAVAAAKQGVTGAEVTAAPIGGGGTAIRGTTSEGAVAILIFSEGKALVVLQFQSGANDPVPTDVIQQVATAQDSKIKSGLSS